MNKWTAPDKIYLQVDGELDSDTEGVTWCEDKQFDTDIEYVKLELDYRIWRVVCEIASNEHITPEAILKQCVGKYLENYSKDFDVWALLYGIKNDKESD